jgi:hypothetical protein
MPKFMGGIVIIKTFETYASTVEEAREYIRKWQEDETEQPEGGIKATRYKLGWDEFNLDNPVPERDKVLAAFLDLMLNRIPGVPREVEESKIITPPGFKQLDAPVDIPFAEEKNESDPGVMST